jgi:hypothetical protein
MARYEAYHDPFVPGYIVKGFGKLEGPEVQECRFHHNIRLQQAESLTNQKAHFLVFSIFCLRDILDPKIPSNASRIDQ